MALLTLAEVLTDLWLDADDASTRTIDVGVSVWADKSGNGEDATQATGSLQPVVAVDSLNSTDTIHFDGINDTLTLSIPQVVPCHIFAVLQTGSLGTGTMALLDRITSSSPYPPSLCIGTDTVNYGLGIYWGTNFVKKSSAGVAGDYIAEFRLSATSVGLRVNGGTEETGTHSQTVLSTWNAICLTSVQQANVKISKLVIVPFALTVEARQKIEGVLAWETGIQGSLDPSHPHYSAAPESSEAAISGSLGLSSTITALSASPLAISGAFGLSFAIEASTYRAEIAGMLALSGVMDAGLTSLSISGVLALSGTMNAAHDGALAINSSLALYGEMTAVSDIPISISGSFAISGIMEAQSYSVADVSGMLALSGTITVQNDSTMEITGSLALMSYITANNGAAACTIQPHNSLQWA
jgi:hypothetical protein